jgi:hypothetical protein
MPGWLPTSRSSRSDAVAGPRPGDRYSRSLHSRSTRCHWPRVSNGASDRIGGWRVRSSAPPGRSSAGRCSVLRCRLRQNITPVASLLVLTGHGAGVFWRYPSRRPSPARCRAAGRPSLGGDGYLRIRNALDTRRTGFGLPSAAWCAQGADLRSGRMPDEPAYQQLAAVIRSASGAVTCPKERSCPPRTS